MNGTTRILATALVGLAAAVVFSSAGCSGGGGTGKAPPEKKANAENAKPSDEVSAERAKLSPNDKALVDAQEWCVVSSDERLGSMGPPLKLDIKGQPVFVCCKGCKKKAESDPDKTLAKVEELKAKVQAEKTGK